MRQSRRVQLQKNLENLLGSRNVYFQPPTGTRIAYPCIIYKLDSATDQHAEDKIYRRLYRYSLTYITKDPDDPMTDISDRIRWCIVGRLFTTDNLNHYVYTLYY